MYKIESVNRNPTAQAPEVTAQPRDAARERALKALIGDKAAPPAGNAPNIVQDAPGSTIAESAGGTQGGEQERPINDLNAKEEPKQAPAQQDPRMADLERKELLIREEARKLKAEKQALEAARSQPPAPGMMTAEQWKAQFLQDPTLVGIQYQEMADKYLSQPSEQDQATQALQRKIAELESRLEGTTTSIKQAEAQAYESAKRQLLQDTQRLVTTRTQDFEAIAADGAFQPVVDLIEATYKEEGYFMSVEDAAKQVEDYLVARPASSGHEDTTTTADTDAESQYVAGI
jgi:hypothetical protein